MFSGCQPCVTLGQIKCSPRQTRGQRQYRAGALKNWLDQIALAGLMVIAILAFAGGAQAAPYAAMVMDARTGEVLHSRNADTRLHPASLTKMMTLYVVFEAVRKGEISLDTKVKISRKAAAEPPSKLGLRAGQRIALRYLIRGAAVKSANDAATALAEAIEGSEAAFARRMNRTAKALGMTRTTFRNAHGLTESGHLSTARDMTIMGRALFYHYPQYYNLFSRRSTDAGVRQVNNTNRRLLAAYRGADGIKTGYTRAAGFNLVASAERNGERIIATVFGGRSSATRNARVAELLDMGFSRAPRRAALAPPKLPDAGGSQQPATRVALAVSKSPRPLPRPAAAAVPDAVLIAMQADIENAVAAAAAVPEPAPDVEVEAAPAAPAAQVAAAAAATPAPRARPEALSAALAAQPAEPAPAAASETIVASVARAAVAEARPAPAAKPQPAKVVVISATSEAPAPRPKPVRTATAEPKLEVVARASTSGGRLWAINLGKQPSRYHAEKLLLQTALQELDTLDEALRKVVRRQGGFEANFVGLTRDQAENACARLAARRVPCETVHP